MLPLPWYGKSTSNNTDYLPWGFCAKKKLPKNKQTNFNFSVVTLADHCLSIDTWEKQQQYAPTLLGDESLVAKCKQAEKTLLVT